MKLKQNVLEICQKYNEVKLKKTKLFNKLFAVNAPAALLKKHNPDGVKLSRYIKMNDLDRIQQREETKRIMQRAW